ncbi:hypothetical protein OM999_01460 [Mycoplasmopsis cynos]|uniref:hypothetical protein n=1 Tax=Mycoplasmopsis cynos TaxID=171284 RepID=UPI0024CBB4A6|nr:hypothetical protein OM999_01460 [Mycoplasmopsis cynos]
MEVKKIISEIEHKYNTEIKHNLGKNSLYKAYIAQLNYLLELGSINQIDELIQKIKSI